MIKTARKLIFILPGIQPLVLIGLLHKFLLIITIVDIIRVLRIHLHFVTIHKSLHLLALLLVELLRAVSCVVLLQ